MQKKISALMMALVLALTLIGCGTNQNQPATNEVVEDSTESTESNTETVESNKETTTEMENKDIVDGEVPNGDKPVETTAEPSPTEKPEPTAEPTPTAKPTPEPTATPEPTPPPHVHEYAETVTKAATCAEVGRKTLTCACGDSKTETIPATGNHDWVTQYTQVEHEALGHVEEIQVQVGTGETRHEYECAYCGSRFDTPDAKDEHQASYASEGNIDHAFARTLVWDYPGEPIYETQSTWVIDSPAWTEQVQCGEACSVCGATK